MSQITSKVNDLRTQCNNLLANVEKLQALLKKYEDELQSKTTDVEQVRKTLCGQFVLILNEKKKYIRTRRR